MSGFGRVAGEALAEWWLSGGGSRRCSEPKAEGAVKKWGLSQALTNKFH